MALFLYPAQLALDFDTGMPVLDRRGAVGQIVQRGNPSVVPTIYEDQAGTLVIPSASRTATAEGMVAPFYVDESFGPVSWYSGGVEYPLQSVEGVAKRLAELVHEVNAAATAAATASAASITAIDQMTTRFLTFLGNNPNPNGIVALAPLDPEPDPAAFNGTTLVVRLTATEV